MAIAAVDLGATSGRVMLGLVGDGRIDPVEAHRFENRLQRRDGHLVWDVDALWDEIRAGLRRADAAARRRGADGIASIGVDTWAVDYVLVGPDGQRLGEAIAYRDARTDGAAATLARRVNPERQFAITGIAQQPFLTLHQLAVDDRPAAAPEGSTLLLLPDYIAFLLTGERRTERTNASTTGMLDVDHGDWSAELLEAAGVRRSLFAPFVEAGERIGTLRPDLARDLGLGEVPVVAVGSHDTASAVLAVPARTAPVAYISSGTWSLVGLELPGPILGDDARRAGFTNEGGVDGTVRFLQNVAGMWLITESLRQWREAGEDLELADLLDAAAREEPGRFLLDATDPAILPPGAMADRVAQAARASDGSDARPDTPAQIVRCVLDSLAIAYRDTLLEACRLAGVELPEQVHVVGGGSRNTLLNQLTAQALEREVVAGPVEATALGNLAVQARALGEIGPGAPAVRAVVEASVPPERFPPQG